MRALICYEIAVFTVFIYFMQCYFIVEIVDYWLIISR
jgi:hypothetical protein